MKITHRSLSLRSIVLVAAVAACASLAAYAGAQPAAPGVATAAVAVPTKVAIVNTGKVFADMQETKDLTEKMKAEAAGLDEQGKLKANKIQELKGSMALIKPDSNQFIDKSRELTTAQIEFEAWRQIATREMDRTKRLQMRALFDKIQAATAKVAQQKGYDLVLSDTRSELPDNLEGVTLQALRDAIMSRTVLYAKPEIDLTLEVTTLLDAEYKK